MLALSQLPHTRAHRNNKMAALAKVARIVNLTAVRRLIGIPGTTGRGAFITSFVGNSLRFTEKRIPPVISR